MNQKLSLTSAPSEDEDEVRSDDAVKQALLRMGGSNSGTSRRGGEQASPGPATPDSRRRRFSQNENVPVEYVSRDRQGGQAATRHDAGDLHDASAGLGRALERERQLREAAERTLGEVRAALHVAQTRLAHLEIEVEEARAQRAAMIVAPEAPGLVAEPAPEPVPVAEPEPPRPARGRGRPRTVRAEAEPEDEPEPVKWWIRD